MWCTNIEKNTSFIFQTIKYINKCVKPKCIIIMGTYEEYEEYEESYVFEKECTDNKNERVMAKHDIS